MSTTYAILGATGNVGSLLFKKLSEEPSIRINVLVRSRSKLERLHPDAATSSSVTVFEGDISDVALVEKCLSGCATAFLAVAASQAHQSRPGCDIARNQANSVIQALSETRLREPSARLPFLVVLSSAETSPKFFYDPPFPINYVVYGALYYIYRDLVEAETLLRSNSTWIDAVFLKPGAISHDVARGHILTEDKSQSFVSFADVAGGMIELGMQGPDRWAWKEASVLSHSKAKVEWGNLSEIAKGLVLHLLIRMHLLQ